MRAVILVAVAAVVCGLASAQTACNAAAGVMGPTCAAGDTCCGDGTMTPSCIAAGSDKQCCRHFLSSTQCNSTQTCCGMLGVGASSFAYCCDAGSTCCKSSGTGDGTSTCCPTGSQCCQAGNMGFCCGADKVCNLMTLTCDAKGSTTAAPPTMAPATTTKAPATTTMAPATTSAPASTTSAPAFMCGTCSADQAANLCSMCSASDRFVCTAGAGVGGCGGADTWGQQPQACSACCECPMSGSTTSSAPNEVTTAAPTTAAPPTTAPTSSAPNEVTTAAPVTAAPPSGSAGNCGFVFVDAQFVLSGASWPSVQANGNAWNSLSGALVSDLASLLGRAQGDISIKSLNTMSNALTAVFTVRSNALAEAARIAALIRDDVPSSAPLPATDGVYASVAGSAQDVSVASHTATSRDAFDSTCAASGASSAPNEVTTAAPSNNAPPPSYSSSQPAEVTTAAPYSSSQPAQVTTAAPYSSSQPAEVTTAAPYSSSQPAEVTTQSPSSYNSPSVPAGWGGYSPAASQTSWMPWLAATAAVAAVAMMVR